MVPIPKVVIPPQLTTGGNFPVPMPTVPPPKIGGIVPMPTIPIPPPKIGVPMPTIPITTPTIGVPMPKIAVPTPTIPMPTITTPAIAVPTPTIGAPVPKIAMPEFQPTIPTPQKQTVPFPTQGGKLRQFGGGIGTTTIGQIATAPTVPTIEIVEETGYSILIKLMDKWNGSIDRVQQLAQLQYADGGYIFDAKRLDVITEIIGMLRNNDFAEVVDFLTDAPNLNYVLWDQESVEEGRIKEAREIAIQRAEETGVKGVGKCRYCASTELVFAVRFLRSGDEPATVFVRCILCGKQWRQ